VKEGRGVIRLRVPRSSIVVTIDSDEINELGGLAEVNVDVVLRASRAVKRQEILLASGCGKLVELCAELLEQQSEVLLVGGRREFPINIETVEETRSGDGAVPVAAHVADNEHVDAGSSKGLAACRGAGGHREGGG